MADAVEWANYCREQVEHPNRGEIGTGCDPVSRRRGLREAEAEVEYRRELLAGLARVQRKWARRTKAPASFEPNPEA